MESFVMSLFCFLFGYILFVSAMLLWAVFNVAKSNEKTSALVEEVVRLIRSQENRHGIR